MTAMIFFVVILGNVNSVVLVDQVVNDPLVVDHGLQT